jgi:hypothetical protein
MEQSTLHYNSSSDRVDSSAELSLDDFRLNQSAECAALAMCCQGLLVVIWFSTNSHCIANRFKRSLLVKIGELVRGVIGKQER